MHQNQIFKDYYYILKITKDASQEEIKNAYRKRMKFFHPDYHRDEERKKIAELEAKEINEAYEILSDPVRRIEYDNIWIIFHSAPTIHYISEFLQEELAKTRNILISTVQELQDTQTQNIILQKNLNKAINQNKEIAAEVMRWKELAKSYEAQINDLSEKILQYKTNDLKDEKIDKLSSNQVNFPRKNVHALHSLVINNIAIIIIPLFFSIALMTFLFITQKITSTTQTEHSAIDKASIASVTAQIAKQIVKTTPVFNPIINSFGTPDVSAVHANTTIGSTPTIVLADTALLPASKTPTSRPPTPNAGVPTTITKTFITPTTTAITEITSTFTSNITQVEPEPILATGRVLVQNLNVRSGPGQIYSVITHLRKNDSFAIHGKDKEKPSWWFIKLNSGINGWISADSELVSATNTFSLSVVEVPPPPKPTPPPIATSSKNNTNSEKRSSTSSSGRWVLIADSMSDFPDNRIERQWWYLFSHGRNNFEWQEMDFQPWDCQRARDQPIGRICANKMTTDTHGDIALQWKARRGGKYLLEWDAKIVAGEGEFLVYKHANRIASQGRGPSLPNSYAEEIIDWEMFFFVLRASSYGVPPEATFHVRVYRWTEQSP